MPLSKRMAAEFIGTFWLVFAGCGAAIYSAAFPGIGIGLLGVAFAFGLSVLTMAYALGHVSGAHLNPAVSLGLCIGGRFSSAFLLPYIVAQVAGAIAASALLYLIASGQDGFTGTDLAANGYGEHSPGRYNVTSAFITELFLTFMFLMIILGSTSTRVPAGFCPIPIGLALTLIILIGGPITNLSVNPARSTGPALFAGGWAIAQLWLFWIAPLAGAAIAGVVYPALAKEAESGATPT